MNPILVFIYQIYKLLVRVSTWAYYRRRTVVGWEAGKFSGPVIVVSNHPSTLLDPLNTAVEMPRTVHFLANAGLFQSRFGHWFFNTFYCIPIERQQDTGGKPLKNAASFRRAIQFLSGGGCFYIAPEGSSHVGRQLQKLKTGTARIALNTEAANGFVLGLRILPVGLNYSAPSDFRSDLLVYFGEPISISNFQKDWDEDSVAAVQKLTAHVAERLAQLTLETADAAEDRLLGKLEACLRSENPLPPLADFQRSQNLLAKLKVLPPAQRQRLEEWAEDARPSLPLLSRWQKWGMVLLLPVALLGFAIHFLPCFLVKKLGGWLNKDLSWVPTFKYCLGLVIYPAVLVLETWLVSKLPGHWQAWAFLAALVPAGMAADWWWENWVALRANGRKGHFAEQKKRHDEVMEILDP